MSGLEKAIRNALEQSQRDNADIRARIYHSARQALEAGLRKQDVTDPELVSVQRQRLEAKIREIEFEERQRLAVERSRTDNVVSMDANPPPSGIAPSPAAAPAAQHNPALVRDAAVIGGGESRQIDSRDAASDAGDLGDLGVSRRGGIDQPAELRPRRSIEAERKARPGRWWQRKRKASTVSHAQPFAEQAATPGARLDVAAGAEQRPRKSRRWFSGLVMPLVVLCGAGYGVWWAGQNGFFVLPDLSGNGSVSGNDSGTRASGFDARQGFSEDWVEVYVPKGTAGITAGGDATVEAVQTSGGPAVRVASKSTGNRGEVSIEVPPAILREMAGKTSTVAVTLQTAANRSVEVAVRCDFGSLGSCSRHRFVATQVKTDALFHVSFDRSLAPNQPGRIYINSDVLEGNLPVFVYSVRILPGQ